MNLHGIGLNAETLMLLGGVAAFLLTILWVRRRTLREKYAVVWVIVASVLLLLGLAPGLIMGFATAVHLSFPAAVLYIALSVIYIFCFSISVSLSDLHRRNLRLTQELAIMEYRVRKLESEHGANRTLKASQTPP